MSMKKSELYRNSYSNILKYESKFKLKMKKSYLKKMKEHNKKF